VNRPRQTDPHLTNRQRRRKVRSKNRYRLSTKIHAMVDALGNPLAFFLTAGQAHDLEGADALLPQMQADTLLTDKAFDADGTHSI